MKRLHLHVGVNNLEESIRFYTSLFNSEPTKIKTDYAKWMLEDPYINFAISTRIGKVGLDHLGIQVDDQEQLDVIRKQLSSANISTHSDGDTTCCYARSEKSWVEDPNGIAWEAYHSMEDIQMFGEAESNSKACCAPEQKNDANSCCG
jgi:catechol-2,3-dioxygenase